MKAIITYSILLSAIHCVSDTPAQGAVLLPGLYNTGVDSSGNLLPIGTGDSHYGWITSNPHPVWYQQTIEAEWITPSGTAQVDHPVTTVPLTLTFDIGSYDPGTLQIFGRWAADNIVTLHLNGIDTGNRMETFAFLGDFSLTSGFQPGINRLTFSVENLPVGGFPNPTGLYVEWKAVVPEPSASILAAIGTVLFGLFRRRASKPA